MRFPLLVMVVVTVAVAVLTFVASARLPQCLYEPGYDSAYFGSDISRVAADLTTRETGHYRVKVHPLSALVLTTPNMLISAVTGVSRRMAMHLLVAINGALLVGLLFAVLRRTTSHTMDAVVFLGLALSSAAVWTWLPVPELSGFGATTILLAVLLASDPDLRTKIPGHYVVGIATMAITITNWMAGLLYSFVFLPRPRALSISLHVFAIVTLLWGVQKFIYPTATFFLGDREESQYLNRSGIAKTTRQFFLHAYASPDPRPANRPDTGQPTVSRTAITVMAPQRRAVLGAGWLTWSLLLVLGALALREPGVDRRFGAMLACLVAGQYALHLAYSKETYIHVLHWLPLLIIMCSMTSRTRFRKPGLALACVSTVLGLTIVVPFRAESIALARELPARTYALPPRGADGSAPQP